MKKYMLLCILTFFLVGCLPTVDDTLGMTERETLRTNADIRKAEIAATETAKIVEGEIAKAQEQTVQTYDNNTVIMRDSELRNWNVRYGILAILAIIVLAVFSFFAYIVLQHCAYIQRVREANTYNVYHRLASGKPRIIQQGHLPKDGKIVLFDPNDRYIEVKKK